MPSVGTAFAMIKSLIEFTQWLDPSVKEKLETCPYIAVEVAVAILGIYLSWKVYKCLNQTPAPPEGEVK